MLRKLGGTGGGAEQSRKVLMSRTPKPVDNPEDVKHPELLFNFTREDFRSYV